MELLFAALGGIILGLAARYALPYRARHGAVLVPAVGGAFAMALWIVLLWSGVKTTSTLGWLIDLTAAAIVAVGVDLWVGTVRERRDAALAASVAKRGLPA